MTMNRETIMKHLKTKETLDEFLIKKDVSTNQLNKAKNNKVNYHSELEYYYDYKEKQTGLAWIDVDNIHAPAREGNSGHSWYNLLYWGIYGLPKNKDANIATLRFYDLLINLTKMSLEDLKHLYEDGKSGLSIYKFEKYIKTGEKPIYLGINDGNHRIILAKVLGVNYVTSKCLYIYEYNIEKHSIYEELILIIKKLKSFLKTSKTFRLSDDGQCIKINAKTLTYMGVLFEDISSYEFNKNAYEYIEHIEILKRYYSILEEIENDYNKQINIYKYIPKGILNFMSLTHKDIYLEEIEYYKKSLLKKVKILKALDE